MKTIEINNETYNVIGIDCILHGVIFYIVFEDGEIGYVPQEQREYSENVATETH